MITIDNVFDTAKNEPEFLVAEISNLIDNPAYAVPEIIMTPEQIKHSQKLQSYYANVYGYIHTLWGVIRIRAGRDSDLIAVRDFLEKAGSVCKLKYAAASRNLTGFQEMQDWSIRKL